MHRLMLREMSKMKQAMAIDTCVTDCTHHAGSNPAALNLHTAGECPAKGRNDQGPVCETLSPLVGFNRLAAGMTA